MALTFRTTEDLEECISELMEFFEVKTKQKAIEMVLPEFLPLLNKYNDLLSDHEYSIDRNNKLRSKIAKYFNAETILKGEI